MPPGARALAGLSLQILVDLLELLLANVRDTQRDLGHLVQEEAHEEVQILIILLDYEVQSSEEPGNVRAGRAGLELCHELAEIGVPALLATGSTRLISEAFEPLHILLRCHRFPSLLFELLSLHNFLNAFILAHLVVRTDACLQQFRLLLLLMIYRRHLLFALFPHLLPLLLHFLDPVHLLLDNLHLIYISTFHLGLLLYPSIVSSFRPRLEETHLLRVGLALCD